MQITRFLKDVAKAINLPPRFVFSLVKYRKVDFSIIYV